MLVLLMYLFILLKTTPLATTDGMYIVLQIKYNIQNNVKMGADFGLVKCMQYNGLPKAQQFFFIN
jgi:hypothetical protein